MPVPQENDETQIQQLIERLYDGVTDPQAWYEALDGLRVLLEGALFYNVVFDQQAGHVVSSLQNDASTMASMREYEHEYVHLDECVPIVTRMPVGTPMFGYQHFSPRVLARSFIHNEWLPSLGYRHTVCIPVQETESVRELVTVVRPADHVDFSDTESALVQRILPDLLRAARLRERTAQLAQSWSWSTAAIDALAQAMVVVDGAARVRHLNPAAQHDLTPQRGLGVRHGLLYAYHPPTHHALQHAILQACGQTSAPASASVIAVQSGQAAPCMVHVLPLRDRHPLTRFYDERPHALLLWSAPVPTNASFPELATTLGITETEARLAWALAQGKNVKQFAQEQGCSWHTARTHARNLLQKTGCHKQSEVALLVRSLTRMG